MFEDKDKKISLLPGEMRKREEEQLKKKKTKEEGLSFHIPEDEKVSETKSKKSFWQKFFGLSNEKKEEKKRKKEEKKARGEARKAEEKRRREEKERQERAKRELKKKEKMEAKKRQKNIRAAQKKTAKNSNKGFSEEQESQKSEIDVSPDVSAHDRKVEKVPSGMRVSLIPEEMRAPVEEEFPKRILVFVLALLFAVFVILGVYLWMVWQLSLVASEEVNIESELSAVNEDIADYEERIEEEQMLQKRINIFGELLDSHVYWTKFFRQLEDNTVEGIYYTSIAADAGGSLVLSALGDNYSAVARQLVAFREASDFISSVRVNSAVSGAEEGMVNFDININLAPGVFTK